MKHWNFSNMIYFNFAKIGHYTLWKRLSLNIDKIAQSPKSETLEFTENDTFQSTKNRLF